MRWEMHIGKREGHRHTLLVPARLIMPERMQEVWITDLSSDGAAIQFQKPVFGSAGMIAWQAVRRPVNVVWLKERRCGLRFATPLTRAQLMDTVEAGGQGMDALERMRS